MVDTERTGSLVAAVEAGLRALETEGAAFTPVVHRDHDGQVEACADCVLTLSGLDEVGLGDCVDVGAQRALVMDIAPTHLVAALLLENEAGNDARVGMRVRRSGGRLSIAVSEALQGRVVNALGDPVDGLGIVPPGRAMPLERPAPKIYERAEVHTPLYTGVLAVDAMFPIGRGQRELIAGDEGTGRTALAVDAMLAQPDTDIVCVYAGIGQRRAETWRIRERLERAGVRFTIVSAPEDATPAFRYLTPYTAAAIGEFYRDQGLHALVIYDDLSAHAVAWRELSLLLGRPPGREAYPGDVFYLHSRLLERSAQLADEGGGGSLTALPICTLESGRLTAYIPTNLVSITDGQLVMSSSLFAAGQRPAIDASLSVSRVGARAQAKILSDLSGRLKLEYAAFLELEAFSQLGTRLESESMQRLELGRRVRALLTGRQGAPLSLLAELVRLALARTPALLRSVPLEETASVATQLATTLAERRPTLAAEIAAGTVTAHGLLSAVETEAARTLHRTGG